MTHRFDNFAAIDWSGAKGERHKGIAIATAQSGTAAPTVISQDQPWSRPDILRWLLDDLPPNSLVGLDLGISLPFADSGHFFPGWDESPADAKSLWLMVDQTCRDDPHLGAQSFVDHPQASAYFRRHGGREGRLFHLPNSTDKRGRLRTAEREQKERKNCRPYSNFNLVGAAQVGKSSLTGMRVLHRINGQLPVWPVDPLPKSGSVIVEIYTAISAIDAGRTQSTSKMRTFEDLNAALSHKAISSGRVRGTGPIDDHSADALLTAAWLRANAEKPELWAPKGLTKQIAQTEGWTFGVS